MPLCFSCGKELKIVESVGRGEACPYCSADMHCCRNCEFYDPNAYNECREPMAERVIEKDRANFCDYFQMAGKPFSAEEESAEAKRKLEEMFKKK